MGTPLIINNNSTRAMKTTDHWLSFQETPPDVIVHVNQTTFSLHKFKLIERSNYIKKLTIDGAGSSTIDLSDIPGGPESFEKAAKFCYGLTFDITVHNVAALRCAAAYLEMTDEYCHDNLFGRVDHFLSHVALKSLSGTFVVLKSCEELLPHAEDMQIVQRCVEIASAKACLEANYRSHSPPSWWIEELSILGIQFFSKVMIAMKSKGVKGIVLAGSIITYTERSLGELVHGYFGKCMQSMYVGEWHNRAQKRDVLEAIVSLFPSEKSLFSMNFLCCLLRSAIFLTASDACKDELEKRISAGLEDVTVDELLLLSITYDGERLFDLDSIKRIISRFVEKEKSVTILDVNDFVEVCSIAMQRVATIVDVYLGEIAICGELSITKFIGISNLIPKEARKSDDEIYRAVDIYLKAHPHLDELEREKVCSVMDLDKLSTEGCDHASTNKRLPIHVVLHARYYDQLMSRSGADGYNNINPNHVKKENIQIQVQDRVSIVKENEVLKSELQTMKIYVQDLEKIITKKTTSLTTFEKKPTMMESMRKTFMRRWKTYKNESKDTLSIDNLVVGSHKPHPRRLSAT